MKFLIVLLISSVVSLKANDSLYYVQYFNYELSNKDSTINNLFSEVDFSDLYSDVFIKKPIINLNIEEFNGSGTVTKLGYYDFSFLYRNINKSYLDTNKKNVHINELMGINELKYSKNNTVSMLFLFLEYETFTDNAINDSIIYWDSLSKKFFLKDTTYNAKFKSEYLAISSVGKDKKFTSTGYIDFNLTDSLLVNNLDSISYYAIDFDDGNGINSYYVNDIANVRYSQNGLKHIEIEVFFNGNYSLKCETELFVEMASKNLIPPPPPPFLPVERDYTLEGAYDEIIWNSDDQLMAAYVYYGCGNTELKKPFIIVEGFDPANITFPWVTINKNNVITENGIIRSLQQNANGMFDKLREEGYDIIIIDYKSGGESCWINAKYFKQTLRKINLIKNNNNSVFRNTVMGVSMGGLVSRIALKQMENDQEDHESDIFISVDSPHNGAYIPMSVQGFFIFADGVFDKGAGLGALSNLAAREMLMMYWTKGGKSKDDEDVCSYLLNTDEDFNLRKKFADDLNILGFPAQTYNIGITNGSMTAKRAQMKYNNEMKDMEDGQTLFAFNYDSYKLSYFHTAKAMNSNSNGRKMIGDYTHDPAYFGNDRYEYYITNPIETPFEALSGGNRGEHIYTAEVINSSYCDQGRVVPLIYYMSYYYLGFDILLLGEIFNALYEGPYCPEDEYYVESLLCFIPTSSALAIKLYDENGVCANPYHFLDKFEYSDTYYPNINTLLNANPQLTHFDKWYGTEWNTSHAFGATEPNFDLNKAIKINALESMLDDYLDGTIYNKYIQNKIFKNNEIGKYIVRDEIFVGRDVDLKDLNKGDVIFESGSDIDMKAGIKISFKEGTKIRNGAKVRAKIEQINYNCDLPIPKVNLVPEENSSDNGLKIDLKIYPNPFDKYININFNIEREQNVTLYIMDQTGRIVHTFYKNKLLYAGTHNISYESSNLTAGVYHITIETDFKRVMDKLIRIK